MAGRRHALQLYTVRKNLEKDVVRTLSVVKAIGYSYVETAGTVGMSAKEFRTLLDENGLTAIGSHIGFEEATKDIEATIDTAGTLGVKYLVVSSIDSALTPDKNAWIACGRALDEGGAKFRDAGLQLCYHNHGPEFQRIEDEFIFDILMGAAQPDNLAAELDTFWVQYAHADPVVVIDKYTGRCPLLHIKDMLDRKSCAFTEVGQGILDWPAIFTAADKAGVKWHIVEQDVCARDPLYSAKMSADFLAKN